MAKIKNNAKPEPEVEVNDISVESESVKKSEVEKIERPVNKNVDPMDIGQQNITVTLKNGHVREYSLFTHGKNYKILAKAYAESQGGEIAVRA